MSIRRSGPLVATACAAALVLSACGGGGGEAAADGPGVPAAEAGGPLDLAAVCPETVVLQQDWQPEAEHGAMYALVGADYTIDTSTDTVTGSLVAQGVDTGVNVEVRPGGANVGFTPVMALMYLDEAITLGAVNSDDAIEGAAAEQPTIAVTSQMTVSPQIMMWDPESHPGATTLQEVAAAGVPVLTSAGGTIPALLIDRGVIQPAQSDTSYEGTPARFVSEPTVLQQGFATAEPYIYENEISQWGRPVSYEPLSNYGYSIYPEPLAVRADRLEELSPCLEKLVPVMQQSQIDYLAEPAATNELIVELVEAYANGWTYSAGVADYSVQAQVEEGFVTDDPASGVFGQFDPARMEEIVSTFGPILQADGTITEIPAATDLYTNDFIDPSISMGS